MSEERPVEAVGIAVFAATLEGTMDLLLSCPCYVEGLMLRAPLVEEGVDIRMPKYGGAFAGVKGYHGIKVLLLCCYCVVGGNPTILFLPT
jgi:hypothetical protein